MKKIKIITAALMLLSFGVSSLSLAGPANPSRITSAEFKAAQKYISGMYPAIYLLHEASPWLRPLLVNYKDSFDELEDIADILDSAATIYKQILSAAASEDFEQVAAMSTALNQKYKPLSSFLLSRSFEIANYMLFDMKALGAARFMPNTYAASRAELNQLDEALSTKTLRNTLPHLRQIWENLQKVREARHLRSDASTFEKVFLAQCSERAKIGRLLAREDEYLSPCPPLSTLLSSAQRLRSELTAAKEKIKENEIVIKELKSAIKK